MDLELDQMEAGLCQQPRKIKKRDTEQGLRLHPQWHQNAPSTPPRESLESDSRLVAQRCFLSPVRPQLSLLPRSPSWDADGAAPQSTGPPRCCPHIVLQPSGGGKSSSACFDQQLSI